MDNNIFGDDALAVSHTFIFGFSHSLFSLPKAAIYWAPVARKVNYLWQLLMCVCVSVWSVFRCMCVCVFICILDLAVVFSGTKQCPAPSAQSVRKTMTSVLTLSFLPSCLDYNQSNNRTVCRSVSCPTALHKPPSRLS